MPVWFKIVLFLVVIHLILFFFQCVVASGDETHLPTPRNPNPRKPEDEL